MTPWIAMLALALPAGASDAPATDPPVGPHAAQAADPPVQWSPRISRRPLPTPTPGPDVMVYGYQAYWAADLGAVPWDHLSHLAVFSANAEPDM